MGISVPKSFVFASLSHLRMVFIGLTIAGLLLVGFICRSFAGGITGPVAKLEAHATQMAQGNLAIDSLPVETSDEIGSLTNAFNTMSTNLRKLISQMATTSEQVAASSQELTANAQQSADASVHVAETVGEVTNSMEQQLADIDGAKKNVDDVYADVSAMAAKARTVTDTSTQTAEAAQKGAHLMENAVKRMGNIEQSVMASADVVQKLGENSNQIGQIVEAISSIAEQTNLLSLNAAIEAARAGEHGRGFAVVADEVRKLAEASQTAAQQITALITGIQKDTGDAVSSMKRGSTAVEEGTASVEQLRDAFQSIRTASGSVLTSAQRMIGDLQTVAEDAANISEKSGSISSKGRQVAEEMESVSAASEEQSASAGEIASASRALAELAQNLQDSLHKFKY